MNTRIIVRMAVVTAVLIFVLGCADLISSLTSQEKGGETTSYSLDRSSIRLTQPDAGDVITQTPSPAEPFPLQSASTPTSYYQPEPTFTLEPTSTSTRVVRLTPTAPRPSPTSTRLPTPIEEQIAAPVPSPIPTDLPTATLTAASEPEIKHVVVITIDGLRPDALDITDTPVLDRLIAYGVYCPHTQTIKPSFTLPAHVSMFNGVPPTEHGIVEALPCIGCRLTIGPTLFNIAHDAGLSTGMVFGKQKLDYLVLPGSVDQLFGADVHDPEVKEQAVKFIEAGLPNVLFIHFPDVDRVGHDYGWMSDHQLAAITFVDGMIGQIMAALDNGGYLSSTLLIITSDHGGHGNRHGDDSPIDRTIPWIAIGPSTPPGIVVGRQIKIYDTAATVLYALKLSIPEHWHGKPVLEIF